jgi:hypothetical protein
MMRATVKWMRVQGLIQSRIEYTKFQVRDHWHFESAPSTSGTKFKLICDRRTPFSANSTLT